MKTYRIIATVREGIRDNQGIAVQKALTGSHGFTNVNSVRIGRTFTITVEDGADIEAMTKSQVNAVMEDYIIEEIKDEVPHKNWIVLLIEWIKTRWR